MPLAMKSTASRSRHKRQISALWSFISLAACSVGRGPDRADTGQLRTVGAEVASAEVMDSLAGELRKQLASQGQPTTGPLINQVIAETSAVLPNTVYYWGVHHRARSAHARQFALVAVTDDHVRVLRTPEDWLAPGRVWRPSNVSVARDACAELAHVASPYRAPENRLRLVKSSRDFPDSILLNPQRFRTLVTSPVSDSSDAGLSIAIWLVEGGDLTRYHCTFPAGRDAARPTLRAEAPVAGAGMVPFTP